MTEKRDYDIQKHKKALYSGLIGSKSGSPSAHFRSSQSWKWSLSGSLSKQLLSRRVLQESLKELLPIPFQENQPLFLFSLKNPNILSLLFLSCSVSNL